MESFNLNIIPGKTRPVCHASQFDTGRVIRVNLFEDANIYTLSGSEEVSLSVRKPDGNVVTVEIENTGDSFIEIVTTEQMTACAGSNLCELKIEDDGKVIGTMNFILETEQDPLEGGIESESSIYNLETQVNGMVTDAVADQYDSNAVIFDQTPTAGHGTGYAVTSAGVKAAIDAVSSAVTDLSGEVDALDIAVQAKQNANDANLATTSKNVVGAINELKNLLTAANTAIQGMKYQRGDTITRTVNIQCPGRINNAGTQCLFTYPLSKPLADDVTGVSLVLSGTPLAYVAAGNVGIRTGTYAGTITENGVNFTVDLTSTSTSKGATANAILANRTMTFS